MEELEDLPLVSGTWRHAMLLGHHRHRKSLKQCGFLVLEQLSC